MISVPCIWIQRKCILDGFRQPEYSYQATTYRKCTILDHQISGIGVHIINTLLPLSYQSAVVIMLNCLLEVSSKSKKHNNPLPTQMIPVGKQIGSWLTAYLYMTALLFHPRLADVPYSLVVMKPEFGWQILSQ